MIQLFSASDPLVMIPMTVCLIIVILLIARPVILFYTQRFEWAKHQNLLSYIKYAGIFSFTVGLAGQIAGLYDAFRAIKMWGHVSAQILFDGLMVSSITTLYGLFILCLAYLAYFSLKMLIPKQSAN